jgi:class 3 adenylate cyclase
MEQVNGIIERYFGAFLEEIMRYGGDVNETAGDGLMVLFQHEDAEHHARAAVRAALGIQRLTVEINAERLAEAPEAPEVGMHIGINSGTASVGATKIQGGGGARWTYTASGPITNLSARVGALGVGIAITEETRQRLGEGFGIEEVGLQSLKNVAEPVMVYRVESAVDEETESRPGPAPAPAPTDLSAEARAHVEHHGRFAIVGILRERESGRALVGHVVRAFDKDLVFDDYLGEAVTDAAGRFEILFTDEQFADLFEQQPDVYLRVYDPSGSQELESTERAVRWNAGTVETFELEIPAERLDPPSR